MDYVKKNYFEFQVTKKTCEIILEFIQATFFSDKTSIFIRRDNMY